MPTISNNSISTSGRPYDNMFGHYKYPNRLNSGSMQSSFITPASNFLYGKNRLVGNYVDCIVYDTISMH